MYFDLSALAVELDPALELTARRFEATCDDLDPATLERERDVVIEEETCTMRTFRTADQSTSRNLMRPSPMHVWLFFAAPVATWAARKLGCYMLTRRG